MKNIYLFLLLGVIALNIHCGEEDEPIPRAIIGTLENNVINLAVTPQAIMTAFEEEYAANFDFIDIDSGVPPIFRTGLV